MAGFLIAELPNLGCRFWPCSETTRATHTLTCTEVQTLIHSSAHQEMARKGRSNRA